MSAVAIDVDRRPGLDPRRLVGLMTEAVRRCALDLSGRVVLTEAASGAYVVTPILAALADASRVIAVTRDSRHGSAAHVTARTRAIAAAASVAERIEIHPRRSADALRAADIVTNSGHVRPLDARAVGHMRPGAAISLMYEAWELRPADVDLDACRRRGVRVGGVNEAHPAVDLLSFLGVMAVKLLTDAGVSVYRSRLLLLCDNPFASFIENGLVAVGARVDKAAGLDKVSPDEGWDAILVALRPRRAPVLGRRRRPQARPLGARRGRRAVLGRRGPGGRCAPPACRCGPLPHRRRGIWGSCRLRSARSRSCASRRVA